MSYTTFHDFCGDPAKSNITVSGANGNDLAAEELHDLVGLLNTQPSVDAVAKVIALNTHHRGQEIDVDVVWDSLPEQTKEMWRGTATKLLTKFFVRAQFGT
jgi:hypothetical protein